jgi:hypothetical protein
MRNKLAYVRFPLYGKYLFGIVQQMIVVLFYHCPCRKLNPNIF